MLEKIIKYGSFIVLALSIIITIINSIVSNFKIKKNKEQSAESLEDLKSELTTSQKLIKIIREVIPKAIKFAEESGVDGGEYKRMLALSNILLECNTENFDYTANASLISEIMEEFVELTKKVNAKPKKIIPEVRRVVSEEEKVSE